MELMLNYQREHIWPGRKSRSKDEEDDAIRLTFTKRRVGLSRWSCRWITHCCCRQVTIREMLRNYIWLQVCCLLEIRTLTPSHQKNSNNVTTFHSVHIPLDSPLIVYGSLWWTGSLAATTTTVSASAAQAHLIPLSHLKPILQRLVFIKNGRFPLLGRLPSAKDLEGRRSEPLAFALDALDGCICTADPCSYAIIVK